MNPVDRTGFRAGRLTVLALARKITLRANGKTRVRKFWHCRCDCGNVCIVDGDKLSGNTRSCGCLKSEVISRRNRTHGGVAERLYNIWSGMLSRCKNRNHPAYHRYGGRGISVAREWHDYVKFREDMGALHRPWLTLERIDNDGNYCKSNCTFATMAEQGQNMCTTLRFEYEGEKRTIAQLAKLAGMPRGTMRARLTFLHWPVSKAITAPKFAKRNGKAVR